MKPWNGKLTVSESNHIRLAVADVAVVVGTAVRLAIAAVIDGAGTDI